MRLADAFVPAIRFLLSALELPAFALVSPSNTKQKRNTPGLAYRDSCRCLVDMPPLSSHTALHLQTNLGNNGICGGKSGMLDHLQR